MCLDKIIIFNLFFYFFNSFKLIFLNIFLFFQFFIYFDLFILVSVQKTHIQEHSATYLACDTYFFTVVTQYCQTHDDLSRCEKFRYFSRMSNQGHLNGFPERNFSSYAVTQLDISQSCDDTRPFDALVGKQLRVYCKCISMRSRVIICKTADANVIASSVLRRIPSICIRL